MSWEQFFDLEENRSGAIFSEDRHYRYELWRSWSTSNQRRVLFVMLNPSSANEKNDDRTLLRCKAFAKRFGFGGYYVGNLFAFVSTDPKGLHDVADPVGLENNERLKKLHEATEFTIVAWGSSDKLARKQSQDVLQLLKHKPIFCLGKT